MKPDIVFFGENLPQNFFANASEDFPKCDLLIIMGSSLVVQPFASLKDRFVIVIIALWLNICVQIEIKLILNYLLFMYQSSRRLPQIADKPRTGWAK